MPIAPAPKITGDISDIPWEEFPAKRSNIRNDDSHLYLTQINQPLKYIKPIEVKSIGPISEPSFSDTSKVKKTIQKPSVTVTQSSVSNSSESTVNTTKSSNDQPRKSASKSSTFVVGVIVIGGIIAFFFFGGHKKVSSWIQ